MKRYGRAVVRWSAVLLIAVATTIGAASAEPTTDLFLGRWTVSNDRKPFAERERPYKTIDIAPCDGSLCGISVSDAGACGDVLFRHVTLHYGALGTFVDGTGRWGDDLLNLRILQLDDVPQIRLFLARFTSTGNDEGILTTEFRENYRRSAEAVCKAP